MALFRTSILLIGTLVLAGLSGCHSDPTMNFDLFSRNRLVQLGRNIESTRDAQVAASEQVTETVKYIKEEAWTGSDPVEEYNAVRRLEARADSRVHTAHSRIKYVETNGEDCFQQWAKEIGEYEDRDLKESSRQNRLKVKASFDAAIAQMKVADDATREALIAIRDQELYLKHHRNSEALPARPTTAADPGVPAEALAKKTALAVEKADAFVASVRPSPK